MSSLTSILHNNNCSTSSSGSCPCKYIRPVSLSSCTAAEYGHLDTFIQQQATAPARTSRRRLRNTTTTANINTLSSLSETSNTTITTNNPSATIITPLHLAAQHGKVDVVEFLLKQRQQTQSSNNYNDNDNDDDDNDTILLRSHNNNYNHEYNYYGCTPLHRSCYSGCYETTEMILQYYYNIDSNHINHNIDIDGNNNRSTSFMLWKQLITCDNSFHDHQTILHKACSAGRYRIVQLILLYIQKYIDHQINLTVTNKTTTDNNDGKNVNNDNHPLSNNTIVDKMKRYYYQKILYIKDNNLQTPIDVAQQTQLYNQNNMPSSSSRWDYIAGNTKPNWYQCIQLLLPYYHLYPYDNNNNNNYNNNNDQSNRSSMISKSIRSSSTNSQNYDRYPPTILTICHPCHDDDDDDDEQQKDNNHHYETTTNNIQHHPSWFVRQHKYYCTMISTTTTTTTTITDDHDVNHNSIMEQRSKPKKLIHNNNTNDDDNTNTTTTNSHHNIIRDQENDNVHQQQLIRPIEEEEDIKRNIIASSYCFSSSIMIGDGEEGDTNDSKIRPITTPMMNVPTAANYNNMNNLIQSLTTTKTTPTPISTEDEEKIGHTCAMCHRNHVIVLYRIVMDDNNNNNNCILICSKCQKNIKRKQKKQVVN